MAFIYMMITDYSAHQFMTAHELASTSALISDYATMRGIPSELVEEYQDRKSVV